MEAEGRPPQLTGQFSVLLGLKGDTCSCECPVSHGTTYGDPQGLANERAEATDHFPDAVLERGHDGAQAPEFQDHAG